MMIKHIKQIVSLLPVLWLLGCSAASDNGVLKDRLLVWHNWSGAEAAQLQALIDDFTTLNPNSRVIVVSQSSDDVGVERFGTEQAANQQWLTRLFTEQARLGLGPDLIIGPSDWVAAWANDTLIAPLGGAIEAELLQQYNATAITAMQADRSLYGLPLWINLMTL